MSPTVFKVGSYRFYFFSREETRKHIHISCPDGEAKFWIEPIVALANQKGLSKAQLKNLQELVEDHIDEITTSWQKHFGS